VFNQILANLYRLFSFIACFSIFIVIIGILFHYKFKVFKLNVKSIKMYTLFMQLSNKSIMALSATTMRYVFIIWYLIFLPEFNISYIILLILLCMVFNICLEKPQLIFFDIFNVVFQYVLMILLSFLVGYLNDIRLVWYVVVMVILLSLFIFVYACYTFFKSLNDIVIKEC
jgi:hypothetical protein